MGLQRRNALRLYGPTNPTTTIPQFSPYTFGALILGGTIVCTDAMHCVSAVQQTAPQAAQ